MKSKQGRVPHVNVCLQVVETHICKWSANKIKKNEHVE